MIQREAGAILEELKGAQNELEKSMSEELAMVAHKRALLDEVEKKEIETMLREGSQNRLRFGSALDKLLVQRQICESTSPAVIFVSLFRSWNSHEAVMYA